MCYVVSWSGLFMCIMYVFCIGGQMYDGFLGDGCVGQFIGDVVFVYDQYVVVDVNYFWQFVGNDYDSYVLFGQFVDKLIDFVFGIDIYILCGFVQDQDFGCNFQLVCQQDFLLVVVGEFVYCYVGMCNFDVEVLDGIVCYVIQCVVVYQFQGVVVVCYVYGGVGFYGYLQEQVLVFVVFWYVGDVGVYGSVWFIDLYYLVIQQYVVIVVGIGIEKQVCQFGMFGIDQFGKIEYFVGMYCEVGWFDFVVCQILYL